jgi:hypothetical protein
MVLVLLLVFAYDRIRDVAATRADVAFGNAAHLLLWESVLHVDYESALNAMLARHHVWQSAASWYYQGMHLSVALCLLLWCYWRYPGQYVPIRNALVTINVVGLAVFWLFPVAPPRLLAGAGFVDSAVVSGVAEKTTTITPALYAAMPSLHLAWAAWVAMVVYRITRDQRARILGLLHGSLTAAVVVATANHYVLDLFAGILLAAVAMRLFLPTTGTSTGQQHSMTTRVGAATGGPAAGSDNAASGGSRPRKVSALHSGGWRSGDRRPGLLEQVLRVALRLDG